MHILFTRSNPIAPDPRVEKEALALSEAGYAVSLLGWDRTAHLPNPDRVGSLDCHRIPLAARYASGIRNFPALLRWQAALFRWLLSHRREFDLIHACDFDTVLPASACRWLFGKKVVYDIFDFYADHLRATPGWVKNIIRQVDRAVINRVDAVILVDDARRDQIAGTHPHRLEIIYNTPDPDTLKEIDPIPSRPANSSLHLAYIGLLQTERGLLEMLNVLARHPEWTLDLAGFGGDEEILRARASKLKNVRFHGRVSYPQALSLSQAADVLFATYDPIIPNHRYSSPNKIFEAMLLGKPVIVAQDTNMDRIVTAADCGLVVPYGDETVLETALQLLDKDPAHRLKLGENARRAYDNHYSWGEMKRRLLTLYQELSQ